MLGLGLVLCNAMCTPHLDLSHSLSLSQGPEHCNSCRNYFIEVREGSATVRRCVGECPLGTYLIPSSGQCAPCYEACRAGCAGPLPYVSNTHGCLECDRVRLNREGGQVSHHTPVMVKPDYYTVRCPHSPCPNRRDACPPGAQLGPTPPSLQLP